MLKVIIILMSFDQDWEPITIGSKTAFAAHKNPTPQHQPIQPKQEDQPDMPQIKKTSYDVAQLIQQARVAQKLTQKELAARVCVPVKDINEIERGIAINKGAVVDKIRKFLRV